MCSGYSPGVRDGVPVFVALIVRLPQSLWRHGSLLEEGSSGMTSDLELFGTRWFF